MANTTVNLSPTPLGKGGRTVNLPVDGGSHIYAATMVAQLNATSMLCPMNTASSGPCIGVSEHESNNTGADALTRCDIETDRVYVWDNAGGADACSEATPFGSIVWAYDDHTIADNSDGGARQPAGYFLGMEADGRVRVFHTFKRIDADTELADFASTAGAGMVGLLDTGAFTSATTVEGALAEIYQHILSTQGSVEIALTSFRETSTAGAVGNIAAIGGSLASDTTPVLGALATTEQLAVIFAATIVDIIATSITLPKDFDGTAPCTLDLIVKTDNTGGAGIEAATYTVLSTWDNNTQVTDTATDSSPSETAHVVTATIAAADIPDAPNTLSLQLVHGTHANDPTHLLGVRLNYKRKLLTS